MLLGCICASVLQVQVNAGPSEEAASQACASTTAMVSSLMSLKASPALLAAFLRTQPGTCHIWASIALLSLSPFKSGLP